MPIRRRLLIAACLTPVVCLCCDPTEVPQPSTKLQITLFASDGDSVANNAAQRTKQFKDVANDVEITVQPDPDSPQEAARIAAEISSNPLTLAVIGHTRSGTTRAALPTYAAAGIPILMPSATSKYALYRFDEHGPWPALRDLKTDAYPRFRNAFRLPPSDDAQVKAIVAISKKLAGTDQAKSGEVEKIKADTRLMIVCETTKRTGSDVYAKPMCDSLRAVRDPKFQPLVTRVREIDLDSGDIYGLVTEIHAIQPRIVIFLGYTEFAENLLQELLERSKDPKQMRNYTFIASDGSFSPEIAKFGSNIYVTSPINETELLDCDSEATKVLRDEVKKDPRENEPRVQAYTYDAILIMADAVKQCEKRLDRACITAYLERKQGNLSGACEAYHLDDGERTNASYSVYSNCNGSRNELVPVWSVDVDKELVHADGEKKCGDNRPDLLARGNG